MGKHDVSAKPKYITHCILHCRQSRIEPRLQLTSTENSAKFGSAVFEICKQIERCSLQYIISYHNTEENTSLKPRPHQQHVDMLLRHVECCRSTCCRFWQHVELFFCPFDMSHQQHVEHCFDMLPVAVRHVAGVDGALWRVRKYYRKYVS